MAFGTYIRNCREAFFKEDKSYSLRKVAVKIGVEPAFLSKVEREMVAPPSEKKIVVLANILNEDPDVLLAMAGKVSTELKGIIMKRPKLFSEVLRKLKTEPDNAILSIVREVKDGDW